MSRNRKGPGETQDPKPGMNPGTTIIRKDHTMPTLTESADKLRSSLPKPGGGRAPEDSGIRLATFPRPEGELRFTWNVYEGKPYLRFQLWSKGDDGSFWPVKGQGFTIKVKASPTSRKGSRRPSTWPLRRRPEARKGGRRGARSLPTEAVKA